jgi:hypothetical protein
MIRNTLKNMTHSIIKVNMTNNEDNKKAGKIYNKIYKRKTIE